MDKELTEQKKNHTFMLQFTMVGSDRLPLGLEHSTYNARSLSSDDRMIELEEEISRIKWNIIGISEVRREGKGSIILNTGHTLYYSGSDEQRHGVGFMVNKNIAHNVINFRGLSDRVAELTIRNNKRYQLKCVQVYLPTTSYTDEEIYEEVYEEIDNIIVNNKAHYNIVMGVLVKSGKHAQPHMV